MIFGAILAGGVGNRMKIADMPKQFLPLGDKPIIIHTLQKFLVCSKFDKIYVGVHPNWVLHMEDLVEKYIKEKTMVCIVPGGSDRNSTIFNIVDAIENDYGVNDKNIVVTHDAVRPFVTLRILNENIKAALEYGACDTVVGATDTIVESMNGKNIYNIPIRKYMYQGQTPQSFNISKLRSVYSELSDEDKEVLTDACNIFVKRHYDVQLVTGEVFNIKITTMNDYQIAQSMIGGLYND